MPRLSSVPVVVVVALALAGPARADTDLIVSVTGAGRVVENTPAHRMDCSSSPTTPNGQVGNRCSANYGLLWTVELQALPAPGETFAGWSSSLGCDAGTAADVCRFVTPLIGAPLQLVDASFADTVPPDTSIATPVGRPWLRTSSWSWLLGASETALYFRCQLDDQAPATCPGARFGVSGLADGPHTFRAWAVDLRGNVDPTPATDSFGVDTVAPTVAVAPLPRFQQGATAQLPVAWSLADQASGVASWSVRYRQATGGTGFTEPTTFVGGTSASDPTAATFTGTPGTTYCFSVAASDAVGNAMTSGEQCTAVPLDDRALGAVGKWRDVAVGGDYLGTARRSSTRGAQLVLPSVSATQLAVLATTGPGAGRVKVLWNGVAVAGANLAAGATHHRQLIVLPAFASPQTGTVAIQVTSSGKPVEIDGLVLQQA
jgi:hypothetical protein